MLYKNIKKFSIILLLIILSLFITSCTSFVEDSSVITDILTEEVTNSINLDNIPKYSGEPFVVINNNVPFFTEDDLMELSFESYADLDSLGRCGTAEACLGPETVPTDERESISSVKPSGWVQAEYDGEYLYNRCHLIAFCLAGENANKLNLITGTRYMNVEGMLPFELLLDEYIADTGNHVLYRVTPIYEGNNLVASGVLMEAKSIENDEVSFCVYCYNVQPGVTINYATGKSSYSSFSFDASNNDNESSETTYIVNINSMKFHKSNCSSVQNMNPDNKREITGTRDDIIRQGYSPCGTCKP